MSMSNLIELRLECSSSQGRVFPSASELCAHIPPLLGFYYYGVILLSFLAGSWGLELHMVADSGAPPKLL